ncbi:hypothetical protein GQX73_g9541 [Xylaria multiplex]|uniref:Uncharacterized protein n=1 Tax=Xylaria multiplex TaxID=323545 RepID=A0A7C8II48_9PEZI|nr:hypothetical protein GQX73_g9541 [Xylaria multiplex]
MPVDGSHLSSEKYGYDFVVATTQASINSGLLKFLAEGGQPVVYLCFLVDPQTGNPNKQVSLDELIQSTNGINPFDIPAGTPYDDPRISPLTTALFNVGIKMQIGLPPGVLPKNLPPMVTLGSSARDVGVKLYCSQFTIIQNSPPSGWGSPGSWNVWSQPSGTPWYITTEVNLVMADLDKQLNTPYFNNHPDEREALKRQLENLSGTAFSLQQLLFDLDNASLQDLPQLGGIPSDSNAAYVLGKSWTTIYSTTAKERGWPLISVTATVQTPDPSQLQMTAFERQVSQLKDSNGSIIQNPTVEQQNVSTLDYLCAANDNKLPGTSSFSWNWVIPTEVNQESGVMSINRNTLAAHFLPQILPTARTSMIRIDPTATANPISVSGNIKLRLENWQEPTKAEVTSSGDGVLRLEYKCDKVSEDWAGASYCGVQVVSSYEGDVKFKDSVITVVQHVKIYMWLCFDATSQDCNVYDMTRTDTYTISVSQTGGLRIVSTGTNLKDDSQNPSAGGFIDFFTGIDTAINQIKEKLHEIKITQIDAIPFDELQAFIFPGSLVFTYKTVDFSDYQDLVCAITYVDPSQSKRLLRDARATNASARAEASPGFSLSYSSEMMENYAKGQIVSPTERFEALQAANGLALLFSIDTSGALRSIKEQSGKANTGWVVNDLSSSLISSQFPGASNVKVDTFDAGQSVLDGTISLALAVEDGTTDWLFISLGNSSSDTSWTSNPSWKRINFDAVAENPAGIDIINVMFTENTSGLQYLVVDINRLGGSSKNIARYNVDPAKSTGRYWVKADVPVDIEGGSYQSCVGQVRNGYVDGIYTSGQTAGEAQLVYSPIENVFGSGPPLPRRLGLPGGVLPSSIATARYSDPASEFYTFTDLFAISGTTLYRFAPDAQQDSATGQPLVTSDVLAGTDQLFAMTQGGVTTLWGTNSSNVVFYISCETSQLAHPGSWSAAVPILMGIEHISPYTNKIDGGNTVFASGNGKFWRLTQASRTNAKVWRSQEIAIPAPAELKPAAFNSYTTTIVVNDDDLQPAADVTLEVSADSSTPLYINGLYYVVGPKPVKIPTDKSGTLTIVEACDDLNAAVLTVAIENDIISYIIDPMNYAFNKIATLNSVDALRNASYPTKTTAGGYVGDPGYAPLIDSSVSQSDLQVVGSRMANLKGVWDDVKPPSTTPSRRLKPTHPEVVPATQFRASPRYRDFFDDIAMAAGDLFQWLKSGVEAVIDIIKDAATDAWHFIAEIGGKVYRAVLDTVEAIVGALEWIFNVIKTAIEQLIDFVKFLFAWDDITRTKDVLYNMSKLFLKDQVNGLGEVKTLFDNEIEEVEKTLSQWAGLGDWSPLGDVASNPPASSATNAAKDQTASSMSFANHFKNNFGQLTVTESKVSADVVQDTIDALLNAVSNEGAVLSAVYTKLQEVATNITSLSVTEAIKQIAVILGEGLLSSVRVVVDALMDVLSSVANTVLELLDTKIYIPIISEILDLIGIPSISFFDLFAWIGAVSFTVVYKIANGDAPFPDNSDVNALKSASSWDELAGLFGMSADGTSASKGSITLPHELAKVVHIAGHAVAGFTTLMGCFLVGFEAQFPSGDNPFSLPAAILGGVGSALVGVANFLVPSFPVENTAVSSVAKACTAAGLISKVIFCGPVQGKLAVAGSGFSSLAVNDGRATSAIVDAILVIPELFVTGWHFYELSQKPASTKQACAIVGEVANLTTDASRISYAVAVNVPEPVSKETAIIVTLACRVVTAGLRTAEAFLVE